MGNIIQFLSHYLLSGQCILCQKKAEIQNSLCYSCQCNLPTNDIACSVCAVSLSSQHANTSLCCASCQKVQPFYDQVFSPFLYQQQVTFLIHQFKYSHKLYVGKLLASAFLDKYNKLKSGEEEQVLPDLIIPVPLHPERLKQRGFNQSQELAMHLSKALKITLDNVSTQRIKATHTQRGLNAKQRKDNLKDAFMSNEEIVAGKYVVIVDDVMTTGNTVNEVSQVLKKANAKRVDVWTMARA